jgi:peptide-methionine (S)-S-oxide reductase
MQRTKTVSPDLPRSRNQSNLVFLLLLGLACPFPVVTNADDHMNESIATFGGGCFWCTEAVYERVPGVISAISGYMGGHVANPTYQDVSTGKSGHAEVIQIRFDPTQVSYRELVDLFWQAHDPTTLNRQGADVGTMYRSVIFFHDEQQRVEAEASLVAAQPQFDSPIVTFLEPVGVFYKAEGYHQDFFDNNRNYPYCRVVILPKLKKLGMEPK